VQLLDIEEGASKPLPTLTPLALDWISQKRYHSTEKALQRKPHLIGSFYGTLLDKIEGLDKAALISELDKRSSSGL